MRSFVKLPKFDKAGGCVSLGGFRTVWMLMVGQCVGAVSGTNPLFSSCHCQNHFLMYNEPIVGNVLVANPLKSAGKTAVCVQVSKNFPTQQNRWRYPAGFYVKGRIDGHYFTMVKLIELKDGSFLFPVPADIRRQMRTKHIGDPVWLDIKKDRLYYGMHDEFLMAFCQEPKDVHVFHYSIREMQQHRYNEWIWLAKDDAARTDRIARALYGLRNQLNFEQMRKATKDWNTGRLSDGA